MKQEIKLFDLLEFKYMTDSNWNCDFYIIIEIQESNTIWTKYKKDTKDYRCILFNIKTHNTIELLKSSIENYGGLNSSLRIFR